MKIWTVEYNFWEDIVWYELFSSKEKAIEYATMWLNKTYNEKEYDRESYFSWREYGDLISYGPLDIYDKEVDNFNIDKS